MAVIPVTPKELPKELRARMKLTPKVLLQGLRLGAERSRTYIVRRTPRDTGRLRNSWAVRTVRRGPLLKRRIELYNDAPYAGIVEKGARPHGVSKEGQEAIRMWVRRHFRITSWSQPGRSGGRTATGTKMRKQSDAFLDSMVFLIVRKLREKGQEPTYFVRDAMPKIERMTKLEVDRYIKLWARTRALGSGGTP